MKHALAVLAFLCPLLICCQSFKGGSPPYTVGDVLPATIVSGVRNSASSSLSITGGPGIVLLNFIASGCLSCYRDLPRLDSLQRQYAGRLQVLLVTSEDSARVGAFLRGRGRGLSLPIVGGDTLLRNFFPHRFLSHTVWLQGGRVVAITAPGYVDDNNLSILLEGRRLRLPVKQDREDYSGAPLLALNGAAFPEGVRPQSFHTAFTASVPGVPPVKLLRRDSAEGALRVSMVNTEPAAALLYAMGRNAAFPVSAIQLRVRDTGRWVFGFTKERREDWAVANTFCYEAVLPLKLDSAALRRRLLAGLASWLGVTVRMERRTLPGFELVSVSPPSAATSNLQSAIANPITLSNLVYRLNHTWWGTPVFTTIEGSRKTVIPYSEAACRDLPTLNRYLAAFGYTLVPRPRETECLIITEEGWEEAVEPSKTNHK
ncbi:MAG: hypothetical protein JWP69_2187 [Flaviaesturariibacter sp.]|nr:hypothetical protein [Flaviaesturariibacter sp.]